MILHEQSVEGVIILSKWDRYRCLISNEAMKGGIMEGEHMRNAKYCLIGVDV